MKNLFNKYVVLRYILAGGTSAFVDLVLLYIFNSVLKIHYLTAAILAFLIAFCVSFILHRLWTFSGVHKHAPTRQIAMYLFTSLLSLGLNTLLMYIFVDHLRIAVLVSQIFAGALVACCSFFLSRNIVFKHQAEV